MKWKMKEPSYGSMIRVGLGSIYHFGIYVSDDEVIQFGLAPSRRAMLRDSEVEVLASDIDTFLAGGFLEVAEFDKKEKKKLRSPDAVVAYAREKLGMRGYSILYNNCEHFANECLSGEHISHQADDVRALFRSMPIADVYLAALPDRECGKPLATDLRQKELEDVSNSRLKREKYYVWQLLGYALQRSLGLKIEELTFIREEGGRYHTDKAEFSLSHSGGALAVAISRAPIGVDIEKADALLREGMAARMMTAAEFSFYEGLSGIEKREYVLKLWTAKEAIFKAMHTDCFEPMTVDTVSASYQSYEKVVGGEKYVLAVATATPERLRFFENIEL